MYLRTRSTASLIDRWLRLRRLSSMTESVATADAKVAVDKYGRTRVSNIREQEAVHYIGGSGCEMRPFHAPRIFPCAMRPLFPLQDTSTLRGTIEGEFSAPSSGSCIRVSLSLFLLPFCLSRWYRFSPVRTTLDSNEVSNFSSQTAIPSVTSAWPTDTPRLFRDGFDMPWRKITRAR